LLVAADAKANEAHWCVVTAPRPVPHMCCLWARQSGKIGPIGTVLNRRGTGGCAEMYAASRCPLGCAKTYGSDSTCLFLETGLIVPICRVRVRELCRSMSILWTLMQARSTRSFHRI
jgi:hypothetical protein